MDWSADDILKLGLSTITVLTLLSLFVKSWFLINARLVDKDKQVADMVVLHSEASNKMMYAHIENLKESQVKFETSLTSIEDRQQVALDKQRSAHYKLMADQSENYERERLGILTSHSLERDKWLDAMSKMDERHTKERNDLMVAIQQLDRNILSNRELMTTITELKNGV